MPSFHDPRLQAALDSATPHIESFDENLDKISEDIKNLEAYLAKHAREVVEHRFTQDSVTISDDDGVSQESEHLVFGRIGERWRILYKRIRDRGSWTGDYDEGYAVWDVTDILESRPLIETKAHVRVRAHKALPDFLEEVARHFAVDHTDFNEKYVFDDDIPF